MPHRPAGPCPKPRIKVAVLGLRGIVNVEGGIEMHARKLYPLLTRLGCDVEVIQRSSYYRSQRRKEWHGVRLAYVWSPGPPGVETAVHSFLGLLYAAFTRPDILHLHAVGPAFLAPFARLLGLRVVFTHHAADYRREKWGLLARTVLEAGEYCGVRYAQGRIAVSQVLGDHVSARYRKTATVIPNGAPRALPLRSTDALDRLGVSPRRYVLCVARLDRVKRQLDLIEAFQKARLSGWNLVLVGTIDEREGYTRQIMARAAEDSRVILAGYCQGKELRELFSHCGVFVLPSSLEGHPIALLEALSYGVPVLASDLPENRVLPLGGECRFAVGDVHALATLLERVAAGELPQEDRRASVKEQYSWRRAARLTRAVYDRVIAAGGAQGARPSSIEELA